MTTERHAQTETSAPPHDLGEPTAADLEQILKKLEGNDRIGNVAAVGATVSGVAVGATAAGVVAGGLGATTLLGSTTLATYLGGILVATTPVGWVIGCAAAGGVAAYALSKALRSGGRQDEKRKSLRERIQKRLKVDRNAESDTQTLLDLNEALDQAMKRGHITGESAAKLVALVEQGSLSPEIALARTQALLEQEVLQR